jgi:acyl dehydratase
MPLRRLQPPRETLMTVISILPPGDNRYFEDYLPGHTYDLGSVAVDEAEVIAFAERFDPQYFHVDAEAAKGGPFGRLAASGWHTAAMHMRLLVDGYLSASSLGSPGIDELRWLRPVFPGDTLHVLITITEARRSKSKPDRGLVHTFAETFNQEGVLVMTVKAMGMILCRGPDGRPRPPAPGDNLSQPL